MTDIPGKICVVGAGPAGARASRLLADAGKEVLLFDHRAPWEKPCGGGITARSRWHMPSFEVMGLSPRRHTRLLLLFPGGRRVRLSLSRPIFTVSRERFGKAMLDDALVSGVRFEQAKVRHVFREGGVSVVDTGSEQHECDLIIGADGVNSKVRQSFAGRIPRSDLCLTLSALLPVRVELPVVLKFYSGVEGYAWIFPRADATSVGIALEKEGISIEELRSELAEFAEGEFKSAGIDPPDLSSARGYYVPSLRPGLLREPVLGGEGWALCGDASGSCDPVTGEGICYALETAGMLARTASSDLPGFITTYQNAWRNMALFSLLRLSYWRPRFYRERNLRLLGFMLDYSPATRSITRDILSGFQEYDDLKLRVKGETPRIALQCLANCLKRSRGERLD